MRTRAIGVFAVVALIVVAVAGQFAAGLVARPGSATHEALGSAASAGVATDGVTAAGPSVVPSLPLVPSIGAGEGSPSAAPAAPDPTAAASPNPRATPRPTPRATPRPTKAPAKTSITHASGPIVVRTNNVTIDGVSITSSSKNGVAIDATGTPSNPLRNLTIRNCRIDGFRTAIELRNVVNLVVEHCTITDASYGGIMVFSGIGGRITGNSIRRIGPQSKPSGEVNAYGIALTRSATLSLSASPRTSGIVVSGNVIEDVPTWHGIDTHAGSRITFSNNIVRRTMRAFFITGDASGNDPTSITIRQNRIERARSFDGNLAAITLVGLKGGTITSNRISKTYPTPYVYDYGGDSTGLTISGNKSIQ